jgi:hypothetical protein
MRVRITRALRGSIDGIQLSRLAEGQVYDVNTSLACYLLSEEVAEPASNDESSAVPGVVENGAATRPGETRAGTVLPRALAADRRRTRKHSKQDKHS